MTGSWCTSRAAALPCGAAALPCGVAACAPGRDTRAPEYTRPSPADSRRGRHRCRAASRAQEPTASSNPCRIRMAPTGLPASVAILNRQVAPVRRLCQRDERGRALCFGGPGTACLHIQADVPMWQRMGWLAMSGCANAVTVVADTRSRLCSHSERNRDDDGRRGVAIEIILRTASEIEMTTGAEGSRSR
jgi:hypothetical protein